jgi:hypothetical protein
MKLSNKNFLTIIVSALSFIALADGLPYGYFTFLRFAVCAVSIYLAYKVYEDNKESLWVWAFGAIAILFNPLIVIHLKREQWEPVNLVVGVIFLLSIFLVKNNKQ